MEAIIPSGCTGETEMFILSPQTSVLDSIVSLELKGAHINSTHLFPHHRNGTIAYAIKELRKRYNKPISVRDITSFLDSQPFWGIHLPTMNFAVSATSMFLAVLLAILLITCYFRRSRPRSPTFYAPPPIIVETEEEMATYREAESSV
jgi:hypothetical protein